MTTAGLKTPGLLIDQLVLNPETNTYWANCREEEGEWEWREVSLSDFMARSQRDR